MLSSQTLPMARAPPGLERRNANPTLPAVRNSTSQRPSISISLLLFSTISNMLLYSISACAILVSLIVPALSHNINLGAHSRECFHEQLHKDDKMTVTFQVGDREFGGSGNLDIDFWVRIACCLAACPLHQFTSCNAPSLFRGPTPVPAYKLSSPTSGLH